VPEDREDLVTKAQAALLAGEWSTAKAAFEALPVAARSPEASFGLGRALWWLGDTAGSLRTWERAYAGFRRQGDPGQALIAAFYLCLAYRMSLGNAAASRGWLGRAISLAEETDLGPFEGWLLLCRAVVANDSDDYAAAERWARSAVEAARAAGDRDLELCAMSEVGKAVLETGRVEEGVLLLDQAMAGALGGEGGDLDTVVLTTCRAVTACSRTVEVRRAAEWLRAANVFHSRFGSPHLFTTCRVHYGAILFMTGRWGEAEAEYRAALRIGRDAERALHALALTRLSELRLAQGRVDEAERLLEGLDDEPSAAFQFAAVHIARGRAAVAISVIERRLAEVGEATVEGAQLVELLIQATPGYGDAADAMGLAHGLVEHGARTGCDLILARGERSVGRVFIACRDPEAARPHLERGLGAFARLGMPLESARTRMLLAEALACEDIEPAAFEAQTALTSFEQLGAARDADAAAAFLRSIAVKPLRATSRPGGVLTARELEILALLAVGLSNSAIAERLFLSRKTVEHHVASVLSKLGLKSRNEAAAFATRHPEVLSAAE
jgi:DNA-binding CsgD family transcriptional regulator